MRDEPSGNELLETFAEDRRGARVEVLAEYMSAIGVGVERSRTRSSTRGVGSDGSCGAGGRSLLSSSFEFAESLSKDGSRGESVRTSTLGGEGWTIESADEAVVLRERDGFAALKRREKLGLFGIKGDFFGLSLTGMRRGVCLGGVAEREMSSMEGMATSVLPKSMSSSAAWIPDMGGGSENSSERLDKSSVRTAPGMLREGPRESMRALRVIRFVAVCRGIRSSNLMMSAKRNQ